MSENDQDRTIVDLWEEAQPIEDSADLLLLMADRYEELGDPMAESIRWQVEFDKRPWQVAREFEWWSDYRHTYDKSNIPVEVWLRLVDGIGILLRIDDQVVSPIEGRGRCRVYSKALTAMRDLSGALVQCRTEGLDFWQLARERRDATKETPKAPQAG